MLIEIIKTDVFDKWFRRLKNKRTQAKIADHIRRMSGGNLGDTKNIGEGIFEKRINYAGGFRLYYYFMMKNKAVLLCGGNKSTQQKDIDKAKEIKKGLK